MWLMSLTKSFRLFPGGSCVPIVYATEQSLSRSSMARADYWCIADHLIKIFGQAVGGVVGAGESYLEAAHRELAEEVGVSAATLEELVLGESRPYDDDQVSLMARCYVVTSQGPFTFDDGEVVEAWWVHRDGLNDLLRRERFLPDSLALLLPYIDF